MVEKDAQFFYQLIRSTVATCNVTRNVKTRGTPRWEVQLQAGYVKLRLA